MKLCSVSWAFKDWSCWGKHQPTRYGEMDGEINQSITQFSSIPLFNPSPAAENNELSREHEEGQTRLNQVLRVKTSLTSQVDDFKRQLDEESKVSSCNDGSTCLLKPQSRKPSTKNSQWRPPNSAGPEGWACKDPTCWCSSHGFWPQIPTSWRNFNMVLEEELVVLKSKYCNFGDISYKEKPSKYWLLGRWSRSARN